jgi:flagellar basal body-associated protein FliL
VETFIAGSSLTTAGVFWRVRRDIAKPYNGTLESRANKAMVTPERQVSETEESQRKIIIVVAIIAAVAIAGLFYLLMRATGGGSVEPTLQGAVRPGSPEFAEFQPKISLDPPEAYESKRALGDIVMNLQTTARNFTGRTLIGLEVKGMVVDHQGKPVREHTVVVLPNNQQTELEPNRTMPVQVRLEGMTDKDDRANIKMEVTGLKFK